MKKLFALILTTLLMTTMAVSAFASESGECKGLVPKVEPGSVVVDGVKDAAYENALCVDINQFLSGADLGTYGKAYMLWTDGSYYLFVEVFDEDVATPSEAAHLNTPWTTDSVEMFFDFSNEAVGLAEQYRIDCTGYPSYYIQGGAYYAYGPEEAKEYFDEYAAARTDVGYNVEMRVNLKEALEDYEIKEGNSIGLQLQINDCIEGGGDVQTGIYNMDSSLNAGSWDVDKYDYVTLGGYLENTAETEATTEAAPEATAEAEVPEMEAPYLDYPSMDVMANSGAGYATLEEAAASIGKTPVLGASFITGSGSFANEGPENLWDNDTATKFCSGEFPTQSLAMFANPITVDGIILATANDNSSNANRNPFEWAVYVSADGENWTAIAYGDDTFLEDVDFTYYAAALSAPVEGVKYVYFQSEGALSGCFQMSELVLTGTASEAAPAETTAPETEAAVEETTAPAADTSATEAAETEAPAAAEETVEAPAETTTEAPQTFDAGVIAAVAAVVSAAGYAVSKKRR